MKLTQTGRGFNVYKFKDSYGESCSLQMSSSAMEPKIWLGTDNPKLMMMASKGQKDGRGWITIPVHEDLHIMPTRMHLTIDQVKELLPILQKFVETGDIE